MSDRRVVLFTFWLAALGVPCQILGQEPTVEAQVASEIVDRMPEGAGSAFPADVGEVFCWTRVSGAAGSTIQHVWIHEGTEFPVTLDIGGSPWRTWSSKSIPPEWSGEWRVEVRDGEGNVLQTVSFTVGT